MVTEENNKQEKPDTRSLLLKIRAGDEAAFSALIKLKEKELLRKALFCVRDYQIAEEVVNQTFFELLSKVFQIKNESNLDAWLYRVLINNCYSRLRRVSREVCMEDEKINFLASNSGMTEEQIVQKLHLDYVLSRMDEIERRVFLMHYLEKRTLAAICLCEKLSMRNVRTLLKNAKKNFLSLYDPDP